MMFKEQFNLGAPIKVTVRLRPIQTTIYHYRESKEEAASRSQTLLCHQRLIDARPEVLKCPLALMMFRGYLFRADETPLERFASVSRLRAYAACRADTKRN